MSYFVHVTFDLNGADSKDYETVYIELANLGLFRYVVGDQGRTIRLPHTNCAGEWQGTTSGDLRDVVANEIRRVFA